MTSCRRSIVPKCLQQVSALTIWAGKLSNELDGNLLGEENIKSEQVASAASLFGGMTVKKEDSGDTARQETKMPVRDMSNLFGGMKLRVWVCDLLSLVD